MLQFESLEQRQLLTSSTPNVTLIGLNAPSAMAISSGGSLYVANSGSNTVSVFAPESTVPSSTLVGLADPDALAFNSSGNLYVANFNSTTVSVFLPGSTTAGITLSGLVNPNALAFDSSGNLYVSNGGNDTVSKFAPGATKPSATLSGLPTGNEPAALIFDSHGNLYVANSSAGSVGTTISEFTPGSTKPSASLTGLNGPVAMAFNSLGNLFVANAGNNTISAFVAGSSKPAATFTGLNDPVALAFDATGNLFVANNGFGSGNSVSEIVAGNVTPTITLTGVASPEALLFDSSGNMFVANGSGTTVSEFTAALAGPSLTATSTTLSYTEQSGAQVIDSGITISDPESPTITGATIAITSGFSSTADTLSFATQNGISGTFNSSAGTLVLSGTASIANYQAALRAVTFTSTVTSNGSRVVSFTVNDGTSSSTAVTRTIGLENFSATHLAITAQPTGVTAGAGFVLTVAAEDSLGTVATGYTGSVTLSLSNNPGGSTPGGNLIVAVTNGVAVFSSLTLNRVGVGYRFTATSSTLSAATTGNISVVPGTASQFVVSPAFPTNVTAGAPFGFTVAAIDAEGNLANYTGSVAVSLAINPGSSALTGTTSVSAVGGVAVFSGLKLNNVATGYELSIAGGALPTLLVGPFNVTALGVATHLVMQSSPPSTLAPGAAFGVSVVAEDDFGTIDTSFSGNVALSLASNPGASTLTGTVSALATAGVVSFAGVSLNNPGLAYVAQATSGGLTAGKTSAFNVVGTLTINASAANSPAQITFIDATDFQVVLNGGPATTYSTAAATKFVFNGPAGTFSQVIFADPFNHYTATQSLTATQLVEGGFEFDANNVANLFVYVSSGQSTATVNVGSGSGSNFFVGDTAGKYSYIADPALGLYSELSGFASENVIGSGGTTYAYVYSASHGAFIGDAGGSSYTGGGVSLALSSFSQEFAVGAADGSDTVTLNTEGGSFVGQPSFSYVSGTFNGAPFLIGALMAANVTAQATNATDPAFFYSYPSDTFAGTPGTSSLTGIATGFASFAAFVTQATGFQSVTVQESGSGTDVANLTSPGNGTFTETPTASTLVVGVSVITVNTFFNSSGTLVPIASKVNATGTGSDTANLYDESGSNALVAQTTQATLTTSVNTVNVMQFGKVNAYQTAGNNNTVHEQALDFALSTVGNWTHI
jgi:hypothetical protein